MSSNMVRITGMNSGLDTEAIIGAYTSKAQKKVQDAKNAKTKNTWTQDAWKSLNSKIYSFYSGTLAKDRMSGAYAKIKSTTSNSCLSVISGSGAAKGVQTAKIISTASAGYLTGSEINVGSDKDNLMTALDISEGSQIKFKDGEGKETTIQIGGSSSDPDTKVVSTMGELVDALKGCGVNANYDAGNKRIFLSAKSTGEGNDFSITDGGQGALKKLGLLTKEEGGKAVKVKASSAQLELNGVTFKSDTNSFSINGSTYTVSGVPSNPDEKITITTDTDYDGIYDVVKDMIKEYNDLMNEMTKLYNADSAKGYEPLSDDQKEQMSEKEIEAWENKIKDSLLRNDSNLYDVMNVMTTTSIKGFEVNGKTMYLSDFGIATMSYFEAEKDERNALHIDGNPDDTNTASKEDKLKAMIAQDPEAVMSFFSQLSGEMYKGMYEKMGSSSLSSIYKVYNDKQLKTEATEWDKKIKELEDKVTAMEDKYYAKFATMEKLLSSIDSKNSAISGMFGG